MLSYPQCGKTRAIGMLKPPEILSSHALTRRVVLAGLPLLLAGCAGGYGSTQDGGFTVPAIDMTAIDSSLMRTEVAWKGHEKPGSIVVNVPERRLYLLQAGGRALRYGVGVGRAEGMNFRGTAVIGRKEKWPHWTPTENMQAAIPLYRHYAGGMNGGPDNPLGAAVHAAGVVPVERNRRLHER